MVSIKAPCPGVIDGENEGEVIADLELLLSEAPSLDKEIAPRAMKLLHMLRQDICGVCGVCGVI